MVRMIPPITKEDRGRFLDKICRSWNVDDCWEWMGTRNGRYGSFCIRGEDFLAHRVSWAIFNEPTLLCVCHRCDNGGCVNPEHLFPGTHLDNMQDMYKKGRRKAARGENNGMAAICNLYVQEIRESGLSNKELALMYDIYPSTVWRIRTGRTWREA